MDTISFVVYGEPVPQGSMRAIVHRHTKRPIMISDNKRTKPWRQEIAGCALAEMRKRKVLRFEKPDAVEVSCIFYFARPKSARKSTAEKTTKPDIDKLGRAVLDALTGIVFFDDSQVTTLTLRKGFAAGCGPQACIRVTGSPNGAK